MPHATVAVLAAVLAATTLLPGCASGRTTSRSERRAATQPRGFVIAAGERVAVDVPVVTFLDAGGFDARREHRWFEADEILPDRPAAGCDTPRRFSARRGAAPPRTIDELRERLTQFVLHYDVAVTSRNCFRVLHDVRGLSVHFLLDVDGTVYQTLDLVARARHAGASNDVSIGIEIAHPGAWTSRERADHYYAGDGVRLAIPAALEPPRGGPFAPARGGWFEADVNGSRVFQRDFTAAQYDALARLVASLRREFPALREGPPRDGDGDVLRRALPEAERTTERGILGHLHVSPAKVDPGPAFDWARVAAPPN